jgi:hypothetical protein
LCKCGEQKKELTYTCELLDVLSNNIHKLLAVKKKILDFIKKVFGVLIIRIFPISISSGNGEDEHGLLD